MESFKGGESIVEDWSGYLEDALAQFSAGLSPASSSFQSSTRAGVAYPFAVVKPEGELTLEDINRRTMRAPSRAVRHPVGDFACRPSPRGPGLSGKPVVAFTRIHTQGTGTITILRTKD